MLPEQEFEILTQAGPGTPCGDLMRRYWQPVALTEELRSDGTPLPVRLLGEDLVLFRNEGDRGDDRALSTQHSELSTTYGLLGLHCSHRGADLSYGRLEDGGLRCIYHGWLYDREGRCLEQPGEPVGSAFHEKIRHTAYPCVEHGRAIFAYLGPGEPPEFPNYEFLSMPDERTWAIKRYHECNYLQANEGNIDLSHTSFLHITAEGFRARNLVPSGQISSRGAAPFQETADCEPTPYGLRSCKIRANQGPEIYQIFVTEFVLPNFTAFYVGPTSDVGSRFGYSVNWHVPIDDTHHWKYTFTFSRYFPMGAQDDHRFRTEMVDYNPVRNLSNRYLQDRELMKTSSYAGMGPDFQLHDKYATEGQGPIQDRTQEHLGSVDVPVVLARKILRQAIDDLQAGKEPANVIRDGAANQFSIVCYSGQIPSHVSWKDLCKGLEHEVARPLAELQHA